jgi:hypothetical protein
MNNTFKKLEAYQKAIKVIESCKTRYQYHAADNYVYLFCTKYNQEVYDEYGRDLLHRLRCKLFEL